ncbi:MAG: alpha/beta hydrolase family protein [Thermoanaerobaculia bacterium]
MSLTAVGRSVSSLVAALFASACCTSLPRLAPKQSSEPPPTHNAREVTVTSSIWNDARRNREVPVRIYAPAGQTAHPVVVFSHGIGEDRDSYQYLGNALAASGFMAVHITHAGTDRAMLERGYRHLYRAVKQKENWVNRVIDVSFALDQLASDPRADLDRVAVAGHSAGAFTAFAVGGLRTAEGSTLRDPRVKVIVPISMPRMEGIVPPDGYDGIHIPVLNMTGTCDASLIFRTLPRHRRAPFEQTSATGHYLVTIEGVNHDTFSSVSDRHHPLIATLTTWFLRGFLLGEPDARVWFDSAGRATVSRTELTVERR